MSKDYKMSAFLQRIQSLQNLCSINIKDHTTINNNRLNHNNAPPVLHCLLFVFGQDASRRSDKNTLSILQYLFIENELNLTDEDYEDLDELVLLIQPAAVSIIWTHAIKKKINQYFSHVPCLIEYIPSSLQEEEEIEAFEHFKCTSFKRMMLDIAQGSTVGVSLPFGCDHILEIEEWPLLQSFAIDSVVTPTGFFTHRYHAIDIIPSLMKLFHTVDSGALLKCITSIDTVVIPHTLALVSMLTSLSSTDQSTITTDDLLEPLSMIYEYGELHCSAINSITTNTSNDDGNDSDADQNTLLHLSRKPMILFGPDTNLLVTGAINSSGNSRSGSSKSMHATFNNTIPNGKMSSLNSHSNQATSTTVYHQQQQYLGDATHLILEGCEPSCSLRWCRTYFTQASIETHDLLISALESTHHRRGSGIYAIEENDSHCPLIQELASMLQVDHVAINNSIANDHHDINTTDFHDGDATITLASASSPSPSQKGVVTKAPTTTTGGNRLLALYVKLWHSLHSAVNQVFTTSTKSQRSIKDVCTELKACIERLVEGKSKQLLSASVCLEKKEDVRVFIECMDAVGNVLSFNDVYLETSNQPCLIYVRVAVYDIAVTNAIGMNAVAVGDTFLYSSYFSAAQSSLPPSSGSDIHNNDRTSYCLTNTVPYICWTSSTYSPSPLPPSSTTLDILNLYTQQLLSRSLDPIMNKSLCLGKRMDNTAAAAGNNSSDSSYKVMIPLLSDNQLIPATFADISLYTQGFVIESTSHINMAPLVVSFARNVTCVWTVDITESLKRALIYTKLNKSTAGSKETANVGIDVDGFLPSGILFVIKLKDNDEIKDNSDKEENKDNGDKNSSATSAVVDIHSLNLHQLAFPMGYNNSISDENSHNKGDETKAVATTTASMRYIGLIMPSDSRSADTLSTTRAHWRKAMNMFDISEYKYSDKLAINSAASAFPESMYDAILSLADLQSFGILESFAKRNSRTIGDDVECYAKSELSFSAVDDGSDVNRRYKNRFGTGYSLLQSELLISDSERLNPYMSSLSSTVISSSSSHRTLLVVLGHAGSGVTTLANILYTTLINDNKSQNTAIQQAHTLDMTLIASEIITSASTTSSGDDAEMASVERQLKLIATFQHAIVKHIQRSEQQLLPLTKHSGSNTAADVVIAPVIVSSILQAHIPDLLKVLQTLYSTSSVFVISVVNASSVLALPSTDSSKFTSATDSPTSTAVTHCNGIETWRSTLSQLCADMDTAGLLGQLIFLVDYSSAVTLPTCSNQHSFSDSNNISSGIFTTKTYKSYFSAFKAKIEENLLFNSDSSNSSNNSSSGTGVRIEKLDATKPFRLDEDVIQYITQRLAHLDNSSTHSFQSPHEKANDIDSQSSLAELSQFSVRCSCPPIIFKIPSTDLISMNVTTFTFSSLLTGITKNSNSCGYVNITNAKKVLSFLFPAALSSSTSAAIATNSSTNTGNNNQSWMAPIKSINKNSFRRLVQLAHCKVFATKKQNTSIAYCVNRLEEYHSKHKQQIFNLRQRLFSIHGTLRTSKESSNTAGTSCQVVYIEACTGAILTKQSAVFNNSDTLSSSRLIIQGIFTDSDERLLGDILECMLEISLPSELSLLTAADLSQDELIKIQTKYIQVHQKMKRISNKTQENFEYILGHCEAKHNDSDVSDTEEDDDTNTNKTNKTKSSTVQESKQQEQPINAINDQQLTDKEKEDAKLAELPIDWSYDGMTYVNFNGSRRDLHPRIDEMVERYLFKKNNDIARYNKMLAEVNEYI